jgi:feruloyl-CoA synthase
MAIPHAAPKRMRSVRIAPANVAVRYGPDGFVYLQSRHRLDAYPIRLTDRLEYWADRAADRAFLAQRDPSSGRWRSLTYAETLGIVRRVSQALVARRLSSERPLLILSGNSIEHALLALAAMHIGVLYAPIAPAYSLQAREYGTLGQIFDRVNPALVFAAEGASYEPALRSVLPSRTELVVSSSAPEGLAATPFAEIEHTPATAAVDEAHARVGPDTIAKILFTSGSTGRPKGVINTQRMLCSNQEMIRSVMPFLADEPPVLCDWLPWNHTAGGNHNFGIVLYNGGTFYIDEGRPTPGAFETTVRNLRDVAATAHFTVPRTYEMLLPYLRADAVLRERFFSRLKLFFYAAAGMTQRVFDELQGLAVETCGEELLWVTGLGATETAPFAMCTGQAGAWAGFVGFPVPGMELKLAPAGGKVRAGEHPPVGAKLEARVRGPNITPGYWRDQSLTDEAFDEEGFYRTGDAMRYVDPGDPAKGLIFDGRLAEDFKLSTGTWVSVGPLRARFLTQGGSYVQDVVIAGHDHEYVAALVFPNVQLCRGLCPDVAPDAPVRRVLDDPRVRETFRRLLTELAAQSTGSSTFATRALLLDVPPSIDARELTDKGSLNQKAVLQNRGQWIDELYATPPSSRVIAV